MHAVVKESLEAYLSGSLERAEERAVEAHLEICQKCRTELGGIQAISRMFGSLGLASPVAGSPIQNLSEEAVVPSPGFYARVMQEVETHKATPTFAGVFALDFAFGRRLLVSSLLTVVVLGGLLVTREAGYSGGPAPDSILAQQEAPGFDSAPGSDSMLVTLTSYGH